MNHHYPSPEICSNYDDVDPISLEDIKDLKHFFYCTSKRTGRVEACDAVPWLRYFVKTPSKWPEHPCTRELLEPQDIWDCYVTSHKVLGEWDADIMLMHSDKVHATVKGKCVELRAQSPLFLICIREIKTLSTEGEGEQETKKIQVRYNLVSSADVKQKRNDKSYTIIATVPNSFSVNIVR